MANMELAQKFVTEDGKAFDTKAEALSYLRKPLKMEALNKINGDNTELSEWLLENEDAIESIFESTKIRRVTKVEKKHLEKALEAVKAANEKAFAFIVENADAIADSFRWPSVKRGSDEEQAATIKAGFMTLTGDNEELVGWLVDNRADVLEAFQAGVVKREVNPKAAEALAAYRANKAAEKAAAEAAKAAA